MLSKSGRFHDDVHAQMLRSLQCSLDRRDAGRRQVLRKRVPSESVAGAPDYGAELRLYGAGDAAFRSKRSTIAVTKSRPLMPRCLANASKTGSTAADG